MTQNLRRYKLAFDTGGTFTDLVLLDRETGELRVAKCLSTPRDPAVGVLNGIERFLADGRDPAMEDALLVGATTMVTNALIERTGAPTALVTTDGFTDIIEIGREMRYDLYDLQIERPEPLVPPELRFGVRERLHQDGTVEAPLDEEQARRIAREARRRGAQTVAVCLLHAYRNGAHERRVREIFAEEAPELLVTISSELVAELREYERISTTTINAYVQPLMKQHVEALQDGLERLGLPRRLYLMLSSGGVIDALAATAFPVRLLESGPAAGALAASYLGSRLGLPNLLSFDMGGTTAKACLIDDGRPSVTTQFEAARIYRFKKGSGLPVKTSVIDLIEIGAGGGSIAHIDQLGLLKVGPHSAGAEPGPACYGRGGDLPTVTDADLVLGYLDAEYFLGGEMRLDREAAERAIAEHVARPLGIGVVEAAWGIHEIVNENMAAAARVHVAERGKDPRRYTLAAFGGAGPVHAQRLARKLRLSRVLVPMGAGVASAAGLLVAPLAIDLVRSHVMRFERLDWAVVSRLFAEMEAEGRAMLEAAGADPRSLRVTRSADMRYSGQGYEIAVPVPEGPLGPAQAEPLRQAFYRAYQSLFGRYLEEVPFETMSWRATVTQPPEDLDLRFPSRLARTGAACARPVYFAEASGYMDTPVLDRYALEPGATLAGPAIIEERESTVVIAPGQRASVARDGSLVIELAPTE